METPPEKDKLDPTRGLLQPQETQEEAQILSEMLEFAVGRIAAGLEIGSTLILFHKIQSIYSKTLEMKAL